MARSAALLIGLVLVCALSAAQGVAQDRVALVFGAAKYTQLRPLANPINDAVAVEQVLSDLGFDVYLETNRNLRRMRRALEDFAEDAAGAEVALVYFAGHGMEVDGRNMLMPVDAGANTLDGLGQSALPLEEITRLVQSIAPVGLVIVDACRTDPFGPEGGRGAFALDPDPDRGQVRPGLGRVGRADNLLFAFAAAPGQPALDGAGTNAPFTEALLRHLPQKGLELRSVLTLVQQDVYDRTGGAQLPYVESGLPRLVFAAGTTDLPERERLLLAMAGLTPADRDAVRRVAKRFDMPLAPLFGALMQAGLEQAPRAERDARLEEAAAAFDGVRRDLQRLGAGDETVSDLRAQAEAQLMLGAADAARDLLAEAAQVDADSRLALRDNYAARTLSQAETLALRAGAAAAQLRRDLAIADYREALALFGEARALDPDSVPAASYVAASGALPELLLAVGDTQGALAALEADAALIQSDPAFDGDDPYWRRQAFQRRYDLGTVLRLQGRSAEAREVFQAALDTLRARPDLLAAWPVMRGDQALVLAGLGDVAFDAGQWDDAWAYMTASLDIRTRLRRLDPDDAVLILTEARAHRALARLAHARQDLDGARAAHLQGLRLHQMLLARAPQDGAYRLGAARSEVALGAVAIDRGELGAARDWLNRGLVTLRALARDDPGNDAIDGDLIDALGYLALVAATAGDLATARAQVAEATALADTRAARDPNNLSLVFDQSASHDMAGVLAMQAGDLAGAHAAFSAGRALRAHLVSLQPARADWKWALLTSHYLVALVSPVPDADLRAARSLIRDPQVEGRFRAQLDQRDPMVMWLGQGIAGLPPDP